MPHASASTTCLYAASGPASHARWHRQAATWLTISLLAVPSLAAQVIHGSAVARGSAAPVAGIMVVLLDSAGGALASALTDEQGRFVVGAPAAGRYRLRLDAVGFASELTPAIAIAEGQTIRHTVHYDGRARLLPPVTVTTRSACVATHERASLGAVLWEEVGKALAVTRLTAESERYRFSQREFERELDPRTGAVRRTRAWDRRDVTGAPYESIDAESLAAHGYVRTLPDGVWYYAPDARTLLSEAFTRTHCLKATSTSAAPGLVGLAFEPTPGRKVPDIRGVLWLEAATSRLQYLEFSYTGLPRRMTGHDLGGRIEFERLATGAWVVREWRIRMPRLSRQSRPMPSTVPGAGPPRLVPTIVEDVAGIIERGGDVKVHAITPGISPATRLAAVAGVVVDSTSADRLAGAEVWLDAPGQPLPVRRVTSDSSGRFRMDSVPPGRYTLTATHQRLDTLGVAVRPQELVLDSGQVLELTIVTATLDDVLAASCAPGLLSDAAVLRGVVRRSAAGPAVAGASIVARWPVPAATGSTHPVVETRTAATDATGRFTLCGVPSGTALSLRAADDRSRGVPVSVTIDATRVGGVTLLAPEQAGEISGVVTTPGGRPLEMVEVIVATADATVRTDERGRFRIGTLAEQRHTVEARAVGYVPVRRSVDLAVTTAQVIDIRFEAATQVLPSVKRVARRDPYRTGFQERRARQAGGHFFTSDQIRRSGYTQVTDLLRTVPGLRVRRTGNTSIVEFTGRGGRTLSAHGCPVAYAMDGIPFEPAGFGLDGEIGVANIEAIEIYDAATAPAQYARRGTGCGLILIWTRERVDPAPADDTGDPPRR